MPGAKAPGMRELDRRHFLLQLAALAAAPLAVVAAPAADPYLIVPGRSVGPLTARTRTADALKKAFGAANVKAQPVYVGEGSSEPGFLICGGQAGKTLEVLPMDLQGQKTLLVYIREGGKSLYRTREGVTLGMTLRQLEKLNGRPFELSGFSWDYGGTVTSWKGGKLAKALDGVTVRFDEPATDALTEAERNTIVGDAPHLSSLPAMQKANPRVASLIVDLR